MEPETLKKRLWEAEGILFDLDNTLYPRERGVFDLINERISLFVSDLTGKCLDDVRLMRKDYVGRYGTTLGGLMRHFDVPPEEFLDFVHDVPVEGMLGPNGDLREFISRITLPKVIFTNATALHAERVLAAMNMRGVFDGICDLRKTGYLGKPHPEAYRAAAGEAGSTMGRTILVDDLEANVRGASSVGMVAIKVGGPHGDCADLRVSHVRDLEDTFRGVPWLITL